MQALLLSAILHILALMLSMYETLLFAINAQPSKIGTVNRTMEAEP
jgi:hypothetical protein